MTELKSAKNLKMYGVLFIKYKNKRFAKFSENSCCLDEHMTARSFGILFSEKACAWKILVELVWVKRALDDKSG